VQNLEKHTDGFITNIVSEHDNDMVDDFQD
jgi:hypothetical protein